MPLTRCSAREEGRVGTDRRFLLAVENETKETEEGGGGRSAREERASHRRETRTGRRRRTLTKTRRAPLISETNPHGPFLDQETGIKQILDRLAKTAGVDDPVEQPHAAVGREPETRTRLGIPRGPDVVFGEALLFQEPGRARKVAGEEVLDPRADGRQRGGFRGGGVLEGVVRDGFGARFARVGVMGLAGSALG